MIHNNTINLHTHAPYPPRPRLHPTVPLHPNNPLGPMTLVSYYSPPSRLVVWVSRIAQWNEGRVVAGAMPADGTKRMMG